MKHYLADLRSKLATAEKCPSMMRGGIGQIPHRKKNNKGFTLVELIVVIVILAILAAILIPGLLKWIDEARDKQYQLEARNVYLATESELALKYNTAGTLGTAEITMDTTQIGQIKKLSGLSDVNSVKVTPDATTGDSGNITKLVTEFTSSNNQKIKATWEDQAWKIEKISSYTPTTP